jgi:lipopolysaccharide export LptBFGC system permease protein LptF
MEDRKRNPPGAEGRRPLRFTKFDAYALTFGRRLNIHAGTRKPEEMSYWQLREYAEVVRQEGYNNAKYLVDMNIKLAFPFISLILPTIGIPLTRSVNKRGNPLAVSTGMAVCFYVLV